MPIAQTGSLTQLGPQDPQDPLDPQFTDTHKIYVYILSLKC